MEHFYIKQEEPADCSSAHIQEFKTNDESVKSFQTEVNLPSIKGAHFCKMEDFHINIKEEPDDSTSIHFQQVESDNEYGTQMSPEFIKIDPLYKTEKFLIDVKEEPDYSSSTQSQQFDSDNMYGTQVNSLSIEGVLLSKTEEFQEHLLSGSSQRSGGNCHICYASYIHIYSCFFTWCLLSRN